MRVNCHFEVRADWRLAGWQNCGAALLLTVLAVLALYRQTTLSMVQTWWRSDTYAHGFLVLPIVLWLLWRRRAPLALQTPAPGVAWLPLVLLSGLAWLVGELAAVNAVSQSALVGMVVLAVVSLLGWDVAREMRFALAYLFFAVPVGDFLLEPLMDWTAQVTVWALRLSGIPVLRVGNNFSIPSGSWSVVQACSGVRYLIASLMLGTLYAYLNYRSHWRRALFVLLAVLLPVVANWVRAYLIVLLGHVSNNRLAAGVDHVLYGWLFFGLVMVLMFTLGERWAEPEASASAAGVALPGPDLAVAQQHCGLLRPWLVGACFLLFAALPPLMLQTMLTPLAPSQLVQVRAGAAVPDLGPRWPRMPVPGTYPGPPLQPVYQNPSLQLQALYGNAGRLVGLYLALYRQQLRGHSLVGGGNGLLCASGPWACVAQRRLVLPAGAEHLSVNAQDLQQADPHLSSGPQELLVWQLYWLHGWVTPSDVLVKVFGAYRRLLGQPDDAAVLLVYTEAGAPANAVATLSAFLRDNHAALDDWLSRAATGVQATAEKAAQ